MRNSNTAAPAGSIFPDSSTWLEDDSGGCAESLCGNFVGSLGDVLASSQVSSTWCDDSGARGDYASAKDPELESNNDSSQDVPPPGWELRFSDELERSKPQRQPRGTKRSSSERRRADGDWWRDANLLLRKLQALGHRGRKRQKIATAQPPAVVAAMSSTSAVPAGAVLQAARPPARPRVSVLGDGQHMAGWSARIVLYLGNTPDAARPLACAGSRVALVLLQDVQQVCAEFRPFVRALADDRPWGATESRSFELASSLATILSALLPLRNVLQVAPSRSDSLALLAAAVARPSSTLQEASFELEQARVRRVCSVLGVMAAG